MQLTVLCVAQVPIKPLDVTITGIEPLEAKGEV